MTTATATITTVTPPTTSGNGITTPTPTQPGMVSNCNKFYKVTDDDGCETIADKNGITLSDFYLFNTQVGTDCSTLWTDYYVCVAVIGTTTTASATITTTKATSTSTNGISTPTPTQPGMVSNCNKFYKVTDDDGCQTIADKNGITLSEFYLWNTQTGSDCSILWTDYYVCVAVIGTTTTASATTTTTKATSTSTNGISTPTPIQPGMVSNCDAFYYVQSDDVTCAQIAHDNGISLLQFYTWNPTVGADCGSLWTSYYVCISIVGVTPSPSTIATTTTKATTTTSAGNGVATPTPIQPGMTTSCKTFHKVVNGDECGAIATNAKIALANFLKWNPQVGSDCSSLWLDYYVCVGVL
jgi:LysM repeat protein